MRPLFGPNTAYFASETQGDLHRKDTMGEGLIMRQRSAIHHRVSRQMRTRFGQSFTVGRYSLNIFRFSWKFQDGSTERDPGYWPIASDPDSVLKIARYLAANRAPSGIAQKCAFAK